MLDLQVDPGEGTLLSSFLILLFPSMGVVLFVSALAQRASAGGRSRSRSLGWVRSEQNLLEGLQCL